MRATFIGGPWHDRWMNFDRGQEGDVLKAPVNPSRADLLSEDSHTQPTLFVKQIEYRPRARVQRMDVRSGYMETYWEYEMSW